MSSIDIALLVPLLWGFYKGFTKGLIITLISIIAFIVGIYIAVHFSYVMASFLGNSMNKQMTQLAAFAITFLAVLIGLFWVGKLLDKIATSASLGMPNKIAGGAFGAIKVAFILGIMISYADKIDSAVDLIPDKTKQTSILYSKLKYVSESLVPKMKDACFEKLGVGKKQNVKKAQSNN